MQTFEIFPIYLGEIQNFEKSAFTYLKDCGKKITCPFFSFLLKSEDRTILVDTGPASPEFTKRWHREIYVPEGRYILDALKSDFGLEPGDLDYLICTHLHWDHASNNDKFPGKKIYLQKRELMYAMDPLWHQRHVVEGPGYLGEIPPAWLIAAGQYELLNGDTVLEDGLEVVTLPGHSPGQQGVLVNTADGWYLLASDLINLKESWAPEPTDDPLHKAWRHVLPGAHHSLVESYQSFEKIERIQEERGGLYVVPAHDMFLMDVKKFPEK